MAGRIRTLKPEWIENERLGSCSDGARVLSAALILLADDYGNGRAAHGFLLGHVWPYDPDVQKAKAKLVDALAELVEIGYVTLYRVGAQNFFHLPGWTKHQYVKNPSSPRVPGLEAGAIVEFGRPSTDTGEVLRRLSPDSTESLTPDRDRDHDREKDRDRDHDHPRGALQEKTHDEACERLAEALRDHLCTEKPDHRLADNTLWARSRASWEKACSGILNADRRELSRALEVLAWVFGDQGGREFRFRVDSPKALREKWDRIETAMAQRPRGSPDRARDFLEMARRFEEEGK